jgi:indolepyruvate ferredoxin oxidoreductase
VSFTPRKSLEELIAVREEFLTHYQNVTYAKSYRDFVSQVHQVEQQLGSGKRLATAVTRYLFKLMAYKDEYEVARLHTQTAFEERLRAQYEPGFQIAHHLAPPLLSAKNTKGELIKRRFGPWIRPLLRGVAMLKFLRGTPLDLFGYSDERREERAAIDAYKETILELLASLNQDNLELAVQIASIPENIRGYGHVKARHVASAQEKQTELLSRWRA